MHNIKLTSQADGSPTNESMRYTRITLARPQATPALQRLRATATGVPVVSSFFLPPEAISQGDEPQPTLQLR
jgi:hypothetical protein